MSQVKFTCSCVIVTYLLIASATFAVNEVNRSDTPTYENLTITLFVTNVRSSAVWFQNVLGFEVGSYTVGKAELVTRLDDDGPEPYAAELILGDEILTLMYYPELEAECKAKTRFSITVDDPGAFYDTLVQRGAEVHLMANSSPSGDPFMYWVKDPDGHLFQFHGPIPGK